MKFKGSSEATEKIKQAENINSRSSLELKRLPAITQDREKIRIQQQQQQIQLEDYRNIQQKQQQQQQQLQQAW